LCLIRLLGGWWGVGAIDVNIDLEDKINAIFNEGE
jgi:hypothetical protein